MCDGNHLGLLGLDQVGHVLETVLEDNWCDGCRDGFTGSCGFGDFLNAGCFGVLGLGLVLDEELEELGGLVLV